MIPEGSPKYNDLVDVVTQAVTHTIPVPQPDGTIIYEEIIEDESLWWKTHTIDSNVFGRCALEVLDWERMAEECFRYMTKPRAEIFAKQVMAIGKTYRRAIDAESSISRRDKHNVKATLLDKLGKNKIEKVFTAKGELKKGIWQSFFGGGRGERELEEE